MARERPILDPGAVIEGLRVRGTGFLSDLDLGFSSALNCLIGARGTGKTSVLELIRFAAGREDDTSRTEQALVDLIPAALGEGGWVEVDLATALGQRLTIRRDVTGEHRISDKDTGAEADVDWPPLGASELAIFSQNQLEDIATDPAARLATLDGFCGPLFPPLTSKIQELQERLTANGVQLIQLSNEIEGLHAQQEQLSRVEADVAAAEERYKLALKAMSGHDEDKKQVTQLSSLRQQLSREDQILESLSAEAESALTEHYPGRALGEQLRRLLDEKSLSTLPHADRLRLLRSAAGEISQRFATLREEMTAGLARVRDLVAQARNEVQAELRQTTATYQDFEARLGAASKTWKEISGRRETLLAQLRLVQNAVSELQQREGRIVSLRAERTEMLGELESLRRRRFGMRRDAANSLNSQIGGSVRIVVEESGALEPYQQQLMDALKGSGLWYARIAKALASRVPPSRLAALLRERDAIALASVAELDAERVRKLIEHLGEPTRTYALEIMDVQDGVSFELKTSDGLYETSDRLSQGQRCTTVLSILLVDSTNPLVIDQPEDNLDNSYVVSSVIDVVARQKATRQFVFVTHNPNIPVLAEAENVIAMDAVEGHGVVATAGVWSDPDVANRIILVMEGGQAAFDRRMAAYSSISRQSRVAS